MPSHRFLRSLLQFYGLELHHLTPSGILHMEAIVTLCVVEKPSGQFLGLILMSH
jgi:hypothetical protein